METVLHETEVLTTCSIMIRDIIT